MTMQRIFLAVLLSLALAAAGCGVESDAGKELDTKSEYSVLQSFEFDYRQRKQSQPYIIGKNALSSGYDVIGLPILDSEHGYVWLVANPSSAPDIKQMPSEADFAVGIYYDLRDSEAEGIASDYDADSVPDINSGADRAKDEMLGNRSIDPCGCP